MSDTSSATGASARSVTTRAVAATKAQAPPGGCRQLSSIIVPIAAPTPTAAATRASSNSQAAPSPTAVDTRLPPSTGHGCASGLAGTAKSSTALAPIGATR